MVKRRLPIGIQSFEKISKEGYYYVDKTAFVTKLSEESGYFFLSRPRRFGKSLFLDTLKQAFLGKRELFQGLYLENNWDWSKSYPVVHLDFGGGVVENADNLISWILQQIKRNQQILKIKCEYQDDYRACLEELIIKAAETYNQRVVVLIDEYDKPILDRIEDKEEARKIRDVLKNLYSVLKPIDAFLEFVFITGVSKFSKVSLFSGLNQLNDISLDREYATICGYTQEELETVFAEILKEVDLSAIKCWYNGYSFCGELLYNPFDVLLYLQKKDFRPYWFETGTPEFLIKLLVDKAFLIPQMEELIATEDLVGNFDIDFIEPENLLFQAGYLTIKRCDSSPAGSIYYLTYPNKEVKISLNRSLLRYITNSIKPTRLTFDLYRIFGEGDIASLERVLKSLFSSIPSEWYRRNEISRYEGYYVSVIYSFFAGAGLNLIPEDSVNEGRIDLTVLYEDKAYVMEFKVLDGGEEKGEALAQIKKKGYHEKYLGRFPGVYLIRIEFDKHQRQISAFLWEKVSRR